MRHGINSEKATHKLMPEWAFVIPDAENTVRIMQEVPCLIAVLNTNQHTPFASIENEKRIVAVGFADEAPDKRPRKPFEEIVEYR